MIDVDEYYKNIERKMTGMLKSTGQIENSFWQNVGKTMTAGDTKRGQMFTDMLGNIERMMTDKKKHGFEQNKKTDIERLIEKGAENGRN